MRRVVSVWFPHWPTDRLKRQRAQMVGSALGSALPEGPVVTAMHDGRRRVIAAVDLAAAALGLRPGMAVAQARAVVPELDVQEAEPEEDAAALLRLTRWCHRMTPLAAAGPPDGLWLDIAGCAHLWGSEAGLLRALLERLGRDGIQARAAVADTPGAAHACARYAAATPVVVAPGQQAEALAALPVAALRLDPEHAALCRRLGFESIGQLARIPRALLARRLGPLPGLRLDQAHGQVREALAPLAPEHVLQERMVFLEPLLTAEALTIAIERLAAPLCAGMERAGLGARQLDLLCERVDSHVVAVRIGTARPSRDAGHLVRLLTEHLDTIDPGMGIEAMRLVAPLAEPLQWEQREDGSAPRGGLQDLAPLIDRLVNRLGSERLYRAAALESAFPERDMRQVPAGEAVPALPDAVPGFCAGGSMTGGGLADARGAALGAAVVPSSGALADGAMLAGEAGTLSRPSPFRIVASQDGPLPGPPPLDHLRLVASLEESLGSAERQAGLQDGDADPPNLAWKRPWAMRRMPPAPTLRPPAPWPNRLCAPSRLLHPPRPIQAIAALPDQPPIAFTWRSRRHRVCRADGPERVHGEWWRHDAERQSVRDYFQVEDETGQRFWLFRQGNGLDSQTGDLSWYLHGLF